MNISEKAMLVNLSVSMWQAKIQDKKITEEIAVTHKVKKDTGKYIKQLIDRNEESYKAISQVSTKLRQYHYVNTLPWLDEGVRILPAKNYLDYSQEVRKLEQEYDSAVKEFTKAYESLKNKAKSELNGLYNEKDYPSQVDRFFGVNIRFMPFPDKSDFRVKISNEESKLLKAKLEKDIKESMQGMVSDIVTRLHKTVLHLSEKLSGDSDVIFRNSIISNIGDACEIVGKLNITDNKNIEEIRKEIASTLSSVSPDALRNNKDLRSEVKKQADDILAKMEKFL